MKQTKPIFHRLTNVTDLQDETIPGQTIIEIAGENRVLIEHHQGVSQYDSQNIGVRVKFGLICVSGTCLELTQMTRERLVISGIIEAVRLIRGR